jgi:hypothetical protein
MVNNSTNIDKTKLTAHFKSLNTIETTTYGVKNTGPGLRQAQKYGGVKLFNVIQTLPS